LEPTRILEPVEISQLLTFARATRDDALDRGLKVAVRDWFLVELALGSGLRVFELAALTCEDMILRASAALRVRHGKGDKARVVRIAQALRQSAELYVAWKERQREPVAPSSPVFMSSNTGRAMTVRGLQLSFARSLRKAGLPHHGIHDARHTYATLLLKASGGNLRLVQRQLGHASLATTQVYLGIFSEDLEQSVETLYGCVPGLALKKNKIKKPSGLRMNNE
tara:strand:+ start:7803 stop:8474 length:672 start_codon:yes stop_codon:yes gene_type:complete